MSSIDKRVVQMEFDNRQFQNGITTTNESLERLKKGLDLSGSAKGLAELERAGKSFSLSSIASGVDNIASKFTALGIMGVTALQRITNAAITTGERLTSALTIDPIQQGFSEYETKMGAIQTILTNTASKGTTLDDVNKTLQDLNEYSDKTIYNFAEMAKNIGTFTAAGVDLETSATAIKGIANLAAGSGSTSQQASTVMYQLSQALAAGRVTLQDWNSVVNGGMGGELFQKGLKETAKQMGIVVDESLSFRESISSDNGKDSWLTSDVLLKTLQKFADDPSLVQAATQVKTFTQLMDTMKESMQSGWATSWENIIGGKEQSTALLTNISNAFNNLIGPSTDARNAMLLFWNTNGGRDAVIEGITNAVKGLAAILKPIKEAFDEAFPPMTGERLVELSIKFRELTEHFKIGESTAAKIKTTFAGLFSVINIGIKVVKAIASGLGMLLDALPGVDGGILGVTSSIGAFLTNLNKSLDATDFFAVQLDKLKTSLSNLPSIFDLFSFSGKAPDAVVALGEKLKGIMDKVIPYLAKGMDKIKEIDMQKVFAIFSGGMFVAILNNIRLFIGSLKDVTDNAASFGSGIKDILGGVKDTLKAYQTQIKAGAITKIAIAIGILAASLFTLSLIDPNKLGGAIQAITALFVELVGATALLSKISGSGAKSTATTIASILAMSTAVLMLSAALKTIGNLGAEGIAMGIGAIGVLMGLLVATATILSSGSGQMIKGATGFVVFAFAIKLLADAIKELSTMSAEELLKGLYALTLVMTELAAFALFVNGTGSIMSTAASLYIIAQAVGTLVGSIRQLGELDLTVLARGLYSLTLILAELAAFALFTEGTGGILGTAAGLLIMAVSIRVLSGAIEDLGSLPLKTLAKGLGAITAALVILGVALVFLQGNIAGAVALAVVSAALMGLALVLKVIGSMSVGDIIKSLLTLAGIFVILGVAALVLTPLIPAILALGAAIILIGAGAVLAGAGLLVVAAGIAAVAVALTALGAAVVVVVTSLLGLIPLILEGLGNAIVQLCEIVIATTPLIVAAMLVLVDGICQVITEAVPRLVIAGMDMMIGVLDGITSRIDEIVTAVAMLITKFLGALSDNMPTVLDAGADFIIEFINNLATTISEHDDELIAAVTNLMGAVATAGGKALGSAIPTFVQAGMDCIGGFIKGLGSGLKSVVDKAWSLGKSAVNAAKKALDSNSPSKEFESLGLYSDQGFALGISKNLGIVKTSATNLGTTAISALTGAVGNISDIISGDIELTPKITPVVDLANVNQGLDSAFGAQRGLNVGSIQNKTASLARTNIGGPVTEPAGDTNVDNGVTYNVTINNPQPAPAETDIRKTLMKFSYGV